MGKYYQVSTLQALALGFSKPVITVEELLGHGDLGLGTFEDVDGEMIILDGEFCSITSVEVRIPVTPAFDTYALKGASQEEIKSVEQGKKK